MSLCDPIIKAKELEDIVVDKDAHYY